MVRLLLAHFIGDFLLQWTAMCEEKKSLPALSGWSYQALHALIYTATVYVFIAEWQCWTLPLLVGSTHFVVDVLKALAEQRMTPPADRQRGADEGNKPFIDRKKMMLFLFDQIFHLGVLVWVYFRLSGCLDLHPIIDWTAVGICALAYLVVLKPTAVFIQIFFSGFAHTTDKKSLPLAGTYIGYLERVMIVSFILSGWMEGIGYLLAAKSVFRFGELRNNKELMRTEYILLGTFLSFTVAVMVGLLATCRTHFPVEAQGAGADLPFSFAPAAPRAVDHSPGLRRPTRHKRTAPRAVEGTAAHVARTPHNAAREAPYE